MKKLYVSFVSETFSPEVNGVANTLSYITTGLKQSQHRVQVITPSVDENISDEAFDKKFKDIDIVSTSGAPIPGYSALKFGFPANRQLLKLWKYDRPDAIYVATEGPLCWSAVSVARHFNIPVISGFHTNFHAYSKHYHLGLLKPIILRYLKFFHNKTRMTLVPTEEMRADLKNIGIKDVEVMSRGVDTELFNPQRRCDQLRESWDLSKSGLAVVYVGRLASEKNIELAVKAFRKIEVEKPSSKFILIGDGPLSDQMKINNPDFNYCGMQKGEALARHYASADMLLFPSETETFGNVIIEAMASGVPTVAYDYAAAHIHFDNHEGTGVAVKKGDENGFIDSAMKLAKNDNRRKLMRVTTRAAIESNCWNTIVQLLLSHIINVKRKANHEYEQSRADVQLSG